LRDQIQSREVSLKVSSSGVSWRRQMTSIYRWGRSMQMVQNPWPAEKATGNNLKN